MKRIGIFLLSMAMLGGAQAKVAPTADLEKIKATLQQRFPQTQIDQIHASTWPGMYEVVVGTELVYTNADASLLFAGQVVDTRTHEDLTHKRWNQLNAIEFSKLPFDLAITAVKGKGTRKLAVFADPECPYCQQLEQELKDVDDVTVYTFLFPLEDVHPGAREKAERIWCSQDRTAAWTSWMLDKKTPDAAPCAGNPTATLITLGDQLKINVTPTLFFADGHRVPGAMPKDRLEKELAATKAQ